MQAIIWWIRRDLRIGDNPALYGAIQAALANGRALIPLFIEDPKLWHATATPRQQFLHAGLQALNQQLQLLGSRLVVCRGDALAILKQLVEEYSVHAIYAEEDYSPYAQQRDSRIRNELPLHLVTGLVVRHPLTILKSDGTPYTVFTPFSKAWKAVPIKRIPLPAPDSLAPSPADISCVDLAAVQGNSNFPAGETEANKRLENFLHGPILSYAEGRNRMDLDGTSSLSPYLRFGMLSAVQAYHQAQNVLNQTFDTTERSGIETWINELIWREFYLSILYHFPNVLKEAFQPKYRNIPWRTSQADLHAWQQGCTGYPIVDASMRQLLHSGWMHNRGRMITASFLVKDLLINWQAGEDWFMGHLLDGDPASNNGGWQWTAGTGTDAAPYFRIFNPILQSKKFDPLGDFIRRWIPELKNVPVRYIHEPWLMNPQEQAAANCTIGKDYPSPIVEHGAARERALQAYRA
ncbi:MAG: deoxyribodipyrimidine photo-lyase [Chloroflexi bacterium HGW-Chloroflexi-10]|nr:MAG: deoxyribodipyrimidine photo-lyase [Chloroflexi bacterium HGW-Chloroflexi-10]